MPDGIFVGLSTIDLIHAVDTFPSPNTKAVAHSQQVVVGGPATNAAITFRHLGGNAVLVTAVGQNRLAAIIKDDLERHSIELIDLMPENSDPPAISSVWVDREGRRSIVSVNTSHMAQFSRDVDPAAVLSRARIVLIDGHAMASCQAWARPAHSKGIPVVLDGGSWKPGTEELLSFVDMAICSADFRPPGCMDEDEVIRYLQAHNVKHVAITRGASPVLFASGFSAGSIPVPEVEVVDTTGAGDVLHGAFCYYAALGIEFAEALRSAALVASRSCRYPGTRRWMQAK